MHMGKALNSFSLHVLLIEHFLNLIDSIGCKIYVRKNNPKTKNNNA